MANLKVLFEKNINRVLKIELYFFLFLVLIGAVYHFDSEAHQYYNRGPYWDNVHGFFSLVIIIVFGVYFWVCIIFPFIWIMQAILIWRFKIQDRKKLWLNLLIVGIYLASLVSLFSLYSIGEHQGFLNRNSNNSI